MEMAKVKEHAANLFIKAFEGLSFDPDKIYNRDLLNITLCHSGGIAKKDLPGEPEVLLQLYRASTFLHWVWTLEF